MAPSFSGYALAACRVVVRRCRDVPCCLQVNGFPGLPMAVHSLADLCNGTVLAFIINKMYAILCCLHAAVIRTGGSCTRHGRCWAPPPNRAVASALLATCHSSKQCCH
jgi:hypothetical protein